MDMQNFTDSDDIIENEDNEELSEEDFPSIENDPTDSLVLPAQDKTSPQPTSMVSETPSSNTPPSTPEVQSQHSPVSKAHDAPNLLAQKRYEKFLSNIDNASDLHELNTVLAELMFNIDNSSSKYYDFYLNNKDIISNSKIMNNTTEKLLLEIRTLNQKGQLASSDVVNLFENLEERISTVLNTINLEPVKEEVSRELKTLSNALPLQDMNNIINAMEQSLVGIKDNLKLFIDDFKSFREQSKIIREDLKKYIENLNSIIPKSEKKTSKVFLTTIISSLVAVTLSAGATYFLVSKEFDNKILSLSTQMAQQIAISKTPKASSSPYDKYKSYFIKKDNKVYFKFTSEDPYIQLPNGYLVEVK